MNILITRALFTFFIFFALTSCSTVHQKAQGSKEGLMTIFHPSASNKNNPDVIFLLGGSEGGIWESDSREVISLQASGFDVVTVGYFGEHLGLPKHLNQIELDQFQTLFNDYKKDSKRCVGVIGVSKGAELSLLLGSYFPVIDMVAAISPSHVVFQASNITLKRNSSWAYKGEELPFVSFPRLSIATMKGVLSGENYLDMHQQALRNKKAEDAARIKVERIKGPVLLLSAKHDHMWPSAAMAKEVVQRLEANQFPYHYEHVEWNSDHYILDDPDAWYRVLDFTESQLGKSTQCGG